MFIRGHESYIFPDGIVENPIIAVNNHYQLLMQVIDDDLAPVHITATVQQSPGCMQSKWAQWFFCVLPPSLVGLGSPLKEGADMAMSLFQQAQAIHQPVSYPLLITASFGAFVSEASLTTHTAVKNLKKTFTILKTRRLPESWPKFSKNERYKEYVALILTGTVALYGGPAEALQTYFFINPLQTEYTFISKIFGKSWDAISVGVSICSFGTILGTETIEAYKTFRNRLAGKIKQHTGFAALIGKPLSLSRSIQDCTQGYIAIRTILNISNITQLSVLGGLATLNVMPNYGFNGGFIQDALDEFYDYTNNTIVKEKKFEPQIVSAFFIALLASGMIEYLVRPLNESFYHQVADDFGGDNPTYANPAFYGLSWVIFVAGCVARTAALNHPSQHLVEKTCTKTSNALFAINKKAHDLADKAYDWIETVTSYLSREKTPSEDILPLLQEIENEEAQPQKQPSVIEGKDFVVLNFDDLNDLDEEIKVEPAASQTPVSSEKITAYREQNSSTMFNYFRKFAAAKKPDPAPEREGKCTIM